MTSKDVKAAMEGSQEEGADVATPEGVISNSQGWQPPGIVFFRPRQGLPSQRVLPRCNRSQIFDGDPVGVTTFDG